MLNIYCHFRTKMPVMQSCITCITGWGQPSFNSRLWLCSKNGTRKVPRIDTHILKVPVKQASSRQPKGHRFKKISILGISSHIWASPSVHPPSTATSDPFSNATKQPQGVPILASTCATGPIGHESCKKNDESWIMNHESWIMQNVH